VPAFDRTADLSRAAAAHVPPSARFVIVEGNYLLLDQEPWSGLAGLFDWTVFLDVPKGELAHRLVQRWVEHGLSPQAARERAFSNDMANVELVSDRRREADTVIVFGR
jgi:pantothenate kinase